MIDQARLAPIGPVWVRTLLAVLSGVSLALAFPDTSFAEFAFFALTPVIIVAVRSPGWWSAAWAGWLALTITWLINLPWVITVMWKQGGLPLPAGIAIFVAMSAILGLYGGAFTVMVRALRLGERPLPWLLIPLCWLTVEYARTHLLTGFAWNLLAVTVIDHPFVQVAPLVGPYVLGAMVLVPSVAAAWLIIMRPGFHRSAIVLVTVAGFLTAWGTAGLWLQERATAPSGETIEVAAVQPNIPLETRWDPENTVRIFQQMVALTNEAIASGAEVIVWPESTVPLTYAMTDFYRGWVEDASAVHDVDIILGSVAEDANDPQAIWNSAYLVHQGETAARYDKIRLVPFGEYVPLREMLFFAEKLVRAVGEFRFGESDEPLRGKASYGPAICYEVVFPQIISHQVQNGAEIIVTVTNDSWFGDSAALRQHLDAARLGAVESQRWMVRAATTGISAIIDPAGRMVAMQPRDTEGILIHAVERRSGLTPYVRFGDWPAIGCILILAAMIVGRNRGNMKWPHRRSSPHPPPAE